MAKHRFPIWDVNEKGHCDFVTVLCGFLAKFKKYKFIFNLETNVRKSLSAPCPRANTRWWWYGVLHHVKCLLLSLSDTPLFRNDLFKRLYLGFFRTISNLCLG